LKFLPILKPLILKPLILKPLILKPLILKPLRSINMSDKPVFTRPKVPTGETEYVTTKQKEITPGQFFVGYETTWKPFQKEVPYSTPKKP
jgi:hypothetical protein